MNFEASIHFTIKQICDIRQADLLNNFVLGYDPEKEKNMQTLLELEPLFSEKLKVTMELIPFATDVKFHGHFKHLHFKE